MPSTPRPLPDPIGVLIADDSFIVRERLTTLINTTHDLVVLGEARSGLDAIRLSNTLKPHIIALSIDLPDMDGFQAARLIMQDYPTRIILLANDGAHQDEGLLARLTTSGALDLCAKPARYPDSDSAEVLLKAIRALSQVGVVRLARSHDQREAQLRRVLDDLPGMLSRPEIVGIVSSTGGPNALEVILSHLPGDFPAPIVVVQHISDEFMDSMTNWLVTVTPLVLKMAEPGERPSAGTVYIAPIGTHLRLTASGRFSHEPDHQAYRHVPSGDVLLESIAEVYGANAIGVILTGMGVDGAVGLAKMRARGAHTIVQDEDTSVVFGMPKAAIDLGGSEYIVPLQDIPDLLSYLAKGKPIDE